MKSRPTKKNDTQHYYKLRRLNNLKRTSRPDKLRRSLIFLCSFCIVVTNSLLMCYEKCLEVQTILLSSNLLINQAFQA